VSAEGHNVMRRNEKRYGETKTKNKNAKPAKGSSSSKERFGRLLS